MNEQNMMIEKKIKKTQRELTFYFLTTLLISWAVSLPAVILSFRGNLDFNIPVKINTYVPSSVVVFLCRFSERPFILKSLADSKSMRKNIVEGGEMREY